MSFVATYSRSTVDQPICQIASIFIALASILTDSWCLPALCMVSPSARNFFTSDICSEVSLGFEASAASILHVGGAMEGQRRGGYQQGSKQDKKFAHCDLLQQSAIPHGVINLIICP